MSDHIHSGYRFDLQLYPRRIPYLRIAMACLFGASVMVVVIGGKS